MNDIPEGLTNFGNEYINSYKIISRLLRYSCEPLDIMFKQSKTLDSLEDKENPIAEFRTSSNETITSHDPSVRGIRSKQTGSNYSCSG